MSRLRNFLHGVASGYVAMGANLIFTVVSVPLALHYLHNETFALWALISQITGYLALVDAGFGMSVGRLLADYKDDRDGGNYGSLLKTGFVAFAIQAVILVLASALLAPTMAEWFEVDQQQRHEFILVMIGQGAAFAVVFLSKIFVLPFWSFQRYDVVNYSAAASLVVNLAVTWASFASNWGLRSLLWGQIAMVAVTLVWSWLAVRRLGLFPRRGAWGRVDRARLAEVLPYARDVFLMSVGAQLLSASQVIVVSRMLGLEAAATWVVCSKAFVLAQQAVSKIYEHSAGALTEMYVRGEHARLKFRFRDIVVLSCSLSVALGALGVLANGAFVEVWTRGRVSWPVWCDALMAAGMIVFSVARCHTGLAGVAKDLRELRFVYFFEGITFILIAWLLAPSHGLAGIAAAALIAALFWSGGYGLVRSRRVFACGFSDLLGWLRPSVLFAAAIVPLAALINAATHGLTGWPRLLTVGFLSGISFALMFWTLGLNSEFRAEFISRIGARLWSRS